MVSTEVIKGVTFITIKNDAHMKIVLSTLGASVFALYYDNELMTLSLKEKEDFNNKELYHGKTIGPVCGRIPEGKIGIYRYEMNEDGVTRHGGNNGLSNQVFSYQYTEKTDTISVLFSHNCFSVEYIIDLEEDSYTIKYSYSGIKLPISMTNHTFFHLGGKFDDLKLKIESNYFVENDPRNLIPLRKRDLLPCLDFNRSRAVSKTIEDPYFMDSQAKGYDHFLYFANEKELTLSDKKYKLYIQTDFDGVQIYSDNYDFKETTIDNRKGIRKALAIEPQDSPLDRKIFARYSRFIKYTIDRI